MAWNGTKRCWLSSTGHHGSLGEVTWDTLASLSLHSPAPQRPSWDPGFHRDHCWLWA